jgi:hypothetical protein
VLIAVVDAVRATKVAVAARNDRGTAGEGGPREDLALEIRALDIGDLPADLVVV